MKTSLVRSLRSSLAVVPSTVAASLVSVTFVTSVAFAQPSPPAPPAAAPTSVSASAAATTTLAPSPPAGDAGAPLPVEPPPAIPAELNALIEKTVDERVTTILAKRKDTAGWKDGFFVQSEDGKHKLRIGAIAQLDARAYFSDDDDPRTDQISFRSLRPELAGTLFDVFDFRLLPDFAGGRVVVQDAYVDLRTSEALKLRFGKFKVPFGLERLQAETATLFAERGLPTQLAPNRDLGVQVFGDFAKGALSYQVGIFNGVADGGSGDGDTSDDKEVAARVFVKPLVKVSPWLAELGIGAAVTYGDKAGTLAAPDVAGLRSSGQATIFAYKAGTTLADTVIADGAHFRATAQASYFTGPVGAIAEYVRSSQTVLLGNDHDRFTADSWQLAAQWVITGEAATWKSVSPKAPFDPGKKQWGAFDVVARFGELRFDDGAVFERGFADPTRAARRAYAAGAGLDWFPNKSLRFVLDFEATWFRFGAKPEAGSTELAADRATERTLLARVQTAF